MSTLDLPFRAEATRRWDLDWIPDQSLVMVRPKVLDGIAIHAGQYYDTTLARPVGAGIVANQREGWSTAGPSATPASLFCGLSFDEYTQMCLRQRMPETAVLVDDPLRAVSASWLAAPTFAQPAIVVRVTKPMPARAGGMTSVATDVYVGRPYKITPGQIVLHRVENDWTERDRRSPASLLVWKRIDPGTFIEPHPILLRGNERSGNRGHAGRPGQRGGSAPSELSSPGDALNSLLNGEAVSIQQGDVRDFLERAADQQEDPDLTDVHVEGHLVFGGNGLGIPRADMPQIPGEHRAPFLNELEAYGVEVQKDEVSPFDLAPTQKEISAKAVGEKLREFDKNPKKKFKPVLVDQNNKVLDGHHHWGVMATVALDNPGVKIPVRRIMLPNADALSRMHDYDRRHGIVRKSITNTPTKDGIRKERGRGIAASTTYDLYGTSTSGNYGHEGRPGERGGSAPSDGGGGGKDVLTTKGTGEHLEVPVSASPDLGSERPTPIKVDNVPDAVAAILRGDVVEIQDVRHVHTVLSKLAAMAKEAKEKGKDAPNFDLCKVSVPKSNLFCGSPLKTKEFPNGVPRIEMPQFKGKAIPGSKADALPKSAKGNVDATNKFIEHLQSAGINVAEPKAVSAAALKATQIQMVGTTVADMMTDSTYEPGDEPIFISSDGYVLDGHHRWAAVVGRDAEDGKLGESTMNVRVVDATISELFHRGNHFANDIGIARKSGKKLRSAHAAHMLNLVGREYLLEEAEHPLNLYGTATSGNRGHQGRPGERGGSAPGEGGAENRSSGKPWHTPLIRAVQDADNQLQPNVMKPTAGAEGIAKAKALVESETDTHKVPVEEVLDALGGNARAQFAALLAEGQQADKHMRSFVEKVAERIGGAVVKKDTEGDTPDVKHGPVKDLERAVKKTLGKDSGDARNVRDVVRSSVAVNKVADLKGAMEAVEEAITEVGGEIIQSDDRFSHPMDSGYRDMQLTVRLPGGTIGEVQVHLKPILEAKDRRGHAIYKEQRKLVEKSHRTPTEDAILNGLDIESNELYGGAWRKGGGS